MAAALVRGLDEFLLVFKDMPAETVATALLLRGIDALRRIHGPIAAAEQLRDVADG